MTDVDKENREIIEGLLKVHEDFMAGRITKEECVAKFYEAAGKLELSQWKIIENLRTKAPEGQRELASNVADLLEAELRKGSGNA